MKLRLYFAWLFALVMILGAACTIEEDISVLRQRARDKLNIHYTVTFDRNGGSGTTPSARTAKAGYSITLPGGGSLTKTGYTFNGWNTKTSGTGSNYRTGSSYKPTASITLYAKWNIDNDNNNYTVTFDLNGGSGTISTQTVSAYSSITLPSGSGLSKTGYLFGGWNTETDGTGANYDGDAMYTPTASITLYAKWNVAYTVTFSPNGGSGTTSTQTVSAGSSIMLPSGNGLTKSGYFFGGWSPSSSGVAAPIYATGTLYTPNNSITLYAKWNVAFTVTFNANGGSGTPPSVQFAGAGSSIILPSGNSLSNAEYAFGGWNTKADGTGSNYSTSYTVTGPVILYARWVEAVVESTTAEVELVWVTGGSYQMGQNLGSGGGSDVTPMHTVTLSGFYMGKYEVTQKQYQAVIESLPGSLPSSSYGVGDNYPVYYVSWYDALVFCNKLSIADGLTPAYRINNSTDPTAWGTVPTSSNSTWNAIEVVSGSTGYRLPSEAQWEYAAKGGDPTATGWVGYTYAGSNNADEVAWYSSNSNSNLTTHEVGTKAANGLGLYDMSGNVWEWCRDWYGSYTSGAQTDPMGASSGSLRVRRGGSWDNSAEYVRSAYRYYDDPSYRYVTLGFRLVRP